MWDFWRKRAVPSQIFICCSFWSNIMAQSIFTGIVKTRKGNYGFIDYRTIRESEDSQRGEPWETVVDIYFHQSDFPEICKVGDQIEFVVKVDETRPEAYRAFPAREPLVKIGLRIDATIIDHSLVPISWQLSPQALTAIAQHNQEEWYLAIVAQPSRKNSRLSFEQFQHTRTMFVVGLKEISVGHAYFDFPAAVDYDFAVFLVRSTDRLDRLEKRLRQFSKVDEIDVWNNWRDKIVATDNHDLPFLKETRHAVVVGNYLTTVSVPEGVFAKPLSPAVRARLEYFGLNDPKDQCDMRGRVIFVHTLGWFLYIIWELVKRLWIGVVLTASHFALGGKPKNLWRRAWTSDRSAYVSDWKGSLEYEPLTKWSDRNLHLFPLPWVILLVSVIRIVSAGNWKGGPIGEVGWPIAIGAVTLAVLLVIFIVGRFEDKIMSRVSGLRRTISSYQEAEEARKAQDLLKELKVNAGSDTLSVHKPVTFRLVWSGIKRHVCRSYSR
jgi:hypothetical protein